MTGDVQVRREGRRRVGNGLAALAAVFVAGCSNSMALDPVSWCVENLRNRCEAQPRCCTVPGLRPAASDCESADAVRVRQAVCESFYGGLDGDLHALRFDDRAAREFLDREAAAAAACAVPAFAGPILVRTTADPEYAFCGGGLGLSLAGTLCGDSTYCSMTSGVCTRPARPGDYCDTAVFCETGTTCVGNVCTALGRTGAFCDIEGPHCDIDFRCESNSCVEAPPLRDGEPCAGSLDCLSRRCVGGVCATLTPSDDYYCPYS